MLYLLQGVRKGREGLIGVLSLGTLLNRLFGTSFDVMDETKRQQTTKGAFLHIFLIETYNFPFRLVSPCLPGEPILTVLASSLSSLMLLLALLARFASLGIWLCPSSYSSTLVMDVEGTDGRERGEDQDFERKSALFSLASTEVLIVNLW